MGLTFELEEPAEGEERTPIPDDTLCTAVLAGVDEKTEKVPWAQEPQRQLRWRFRIEDGDYQDRIVYGRTGVKFVKHPNCKLYAWSQAILGMEFPAGYSLDLDTLLDRPCRILIELRIWEKEGQERQSNNVLEVLPAHGDLQQSPFDEPY
jgi:hypothetical protein